MTFTTRPAQSADHARFVTLFAELGVPDPLPGLAAFEGMVPQMIVALDGDLVVGYASWRVYGTLAHVVNVVSAPDRRGEGIGHVLMPVVRERVIAEGATRWYLNVKRDNVPAIRLYERHGLAIECPAWTLACRWSMRAALPESPPSNVVTPTPEAVSALDVVPGHFAAMAQRGRLIIGLERGELLACAAFDPRYPGAYPFAARSPIHARALLDALYEHRDPVHGDLVRISLDRDEALARTLLDAGASSTFELWRMHGGLA